MRKVGLSSAVIAHRFAQKIASASFCVLAFASIAGCGGSGSGGTQSGGSAGANFGCDGGCAHQNLSTEDVRQILRQAVTYTQSLGVAGTFAVLDRTGNVLGLYRMTGALATTTVNGQIGAQGGLEGTAVPATLAAISKAGTGAYLSSQGNAFSTRTASQIIQEHFLPGQTNQPGGPLFGVQFSQLVCGDVTVLDRSALPSGVRPGKSVQGSSIGPRPLPLGLSADPGGLPIYKEGDLVGGVGVEIDGVYTLDRNPLDYDNDLEEEVALAMSRGFEAPAERVGDNIFLAGRTLRFADTSYDTISVPETLASIDEKCVVAEPLYFAGTIRAGAPFGSPQSGIAETTRAGVPAMILVDEAGNARFPSRAGRALPGGQQLTASEVDALLDSALLTAHRARAAIRTPRDTAARVSIFVIDDRGEPLGFVRSQDAPVFGVDVSLQKARAAAFFSSSDAGGLLSQAFAAGVGLSRDYAAAYQSFTGGLSLDGQYAFADRSVGNLSRPFFVDGIDGQPPGPFSLPFPGSAAGATWSPFNTGLQLDLVASGVVGPILNPKSVSGSCASSQIFGGRLRNGIQIFPGAAPLYRNGILIGAIGVSGDGIDQDDIVSFYGASAEGLRFAGHADVGDPIRGFNSPPDIRADRIPLPVRDSRLRYVNCPESPFIGSNDQNVCQGL